MTQVSLSEFADKVSQIMPVVLRGFLRRQSNELSKGKITLPQLLVLEILHREGELKMSDLAHLMNVTTAAMTGIVERLVKHVYVARIDDSHDRRIIKIKLTIKGSGLVRNLNEQKRKMLIKVFGEISDDDRQNYLRILSQIRDILTKEQQT